MTPKTRCRRLATDLLSTVLLSTVLLSTILLSTALLAPATVTPAAAQTFDSSPAPDELCSLRGDGFRVDLLQVGRCCPNVLELWIDTGDGGRRVALETGIGRPGRMTLTPDDKVLLGGTLGRGARALVIIDVASGTLQDELHTFDYRVSPSQRRVVYSRHFAHDAPESERRSLLLLYDLSRDAAGNRSGDPAALDLANAGRPIYPEANAAAGSYQPDLEPPHRYLSPFLWSADETRIVFFELFEGRYALVELELAADGGAPRVRRRDVPPETLGSGGVAHPPVVSLRWIDARTVGLQGLAGSGAAGGGAAGGGAAGGVARGELAVPLD